MMMMFGENARKVTAFTALLFVSLTMCTVVSASGGARRESQSQVVLTGLLQATGQSCNFNSNINVNTGMAEEKTESFVWVEGCGKCKCGKTVVADEYNNGPDGRDDKHIRRAAKCREKHIRGSCGIFDNLEPYWTPNQRTYCRSCINKRKTKWRVHNYFISSLPAVGLIVRAALDGGMSGEAAMVGGSIFGVVLLYWILLTCYFSNGIDVNCVKVRMGWFIVLGGGFAATGLGLGIAAFKTATVDTIKGAVPQDGIGPLMFPAIVCFVLGGLMIWLYHHCKNGNYCLKI